MKRNVLFFIADQMRADTLGCAGHPLVRTPNLDDLARRGVRFRNAHTPCPICVPARAALATGRYPHKCTGLKGNSGRIRDGEVKIAELFAAHGYATYASGKLHYVPYPPPGEPRLLHGFQEAALAESGRIVGKYDPTGKQSGIEDYHDYLRRVGWGGYSRAHGVGNNDIHPAPSPLPAEHYVDSWVATQAIEYLDHHRRRKPGQPFFLYMGFPKPHAPYDPPRPFDALYDPRAVPAPACAKDALPRTPTKHLAGVMHGWNLFAPEMARVARAHYYGQVTHQDAQVGRVLEHCRQAGLLDDTVVVYTADHGDLMGDFGFYAKSCFYAGSVNIPLIVHDPSGPANGRTSDALCGLQDLLPTLAAMNGLPLPRPVDGLDLGPLLAGRSEAVRDVYVSCCHDEPRQTFMANDGRHKYLWSEVNGVEEFYDLQRDPQELENLAGSPAAAGPMAALRERLVRWIVENGDHGALEGGKLKVNRTDLLAGAEFTRSAMGWRWY